METHRGKLLKNYGDIGERRNLSLAFALVSELFTFLAFINPTALGILDFI